MRKSAWNRWKCASCALLYPFLDDFQTSSKEAASIPCSPPKWRMKVLRKESPAGTGGSGLVKSWSSRKHANAGACGGVIRGTGVSPTGSGPPVAEVVAIRSFRAFRNRPRAVSVRAEPVLVVTKSNRRAAGAAAALDAVSRRRLASTMSRVVTDVRNHGVSMGLGGPSPGKPIVLSKRPVGTTKSGVSWGPRSCGCPSPFCGSRSLGRGKASWPPRES